MPHFIKTIMYNYMLIIIWMLIIFTCFDLRSLIATESQPAWWSPSPSLLPPGQPVSPPLRTNSVVRAAVQENSCLTTNVTWCNTLSTRRNTILDFFIFGLKSFIFFWIFHIIIQFEIWNPKIKHWVVGPELHLHLSIYLNMHKSKLFSLFRPASLLALLTQ